MADLIGKRITDLTDVSVISDSMYLMVDATTYTEAKKIAATDLVPEIAFTDTNVDGNVVITMS